MSSGSRVIRPIALCAGRLAVGTARHSQRILQPDTITTQIAEAFFCAIRSQAEAHKLLSREHFSVDGTLLEAAAALKSLRPLAESDDEGQEPPCGGTRNPDVDFHGQRRGNATHRSATDPEARLARKGAGKEAKLCYAGHTLIENRHGLICECELTQASGSAEREAALRLLTKQRARRRGRLSVGADKGYDTKDFVAGVRELGATPHVAVKDRCSAIDGRTTRHAGYATSQRRRKLIEEGYGWMKDIGGLRKLRHRGTVKVAALFTFTCAAYNLVRLRTLLAEPAVALR